MSKREAAILADRLSHIYLTSATVTGLPPEAVCLLATTSIERGIEAIFRLNDLVPPNRDQALFVFTERFVLNGGFPRGIEKDIYRLYRMRDGKEDLDKDGGLSLAKSVLKELHRTIKAWLKEKERETA